MVCRQTATMSIIRIHFISIIIPSVNINMIIIWVDWHCAIIFIFVLIVILFLFCSCPSHCSSSFSSCRRSGDFFRFHHIRLRLIMLITVIFIDGFFI